jgi:hypothetical protein
LVEAEFKRRLVAGNIESGIAKQGEVLAAWLKESHPTLAQMTSGTIQNKIRTAWNSRI